MKCTCTTLLIAGILTTTVSAQLTAYSDKKHVHILADKTTLSISDSSVNLLGANQSGAATIAGIVLPPTIDYVTAAMEATVLGNTKKYQATYVCSASCDHFYAGVNEAMLPNLTIRRWIKDKKGNDKLAVSMHLVPELSADRTAFRFVAGDSFVYNYSIAKTTGPYDYLYLQMTINVKSVSVQEDAYKVADLRTTILRIPMVHVGHTRSLDESVYSGWIPLPPPSTVKIITESTAGRKNAYEFRPVSGKTGLYEIEVSVTEFNPYKAMAEQHQAFLEKTDNKLSGALKAGIKASTEND